MPKPSKNPSKDPQLLELLELLRKYIDSAPDAGPKTPSRPRPPISPWSAFLSKRRQEQKGQPPLPLKKFMQDSSVLYHQLSPEDRHDLNVIVAADKKRYLDELENYNLAHPTKLRKRNKAPKSSEVPDGEPPEPVVGNSTRPSKKRRNSIVSTTPNEGVVDAAAEPVRLCET